MAPKRKLKRVGEQTVQTAKDAADASAAAASKTSIAAFGNLLLGAPRSRPLAGR